MYRNTRLFALTGHVDMNVKVYTVGGESLLVYGSTVWMMEYRGWDISMVLGA